TGGRPGRRVSAPVLFAKRNCVPDRDFHVVEKQLALGQWPLPQFLQRLAVRHARQVEGHDYLDTVWMAFLVEESVSVVGDDREDCNLGDRAVGYPRRTLPVDDDVAARSEEHTSEL